MERQCLFSAKKSRSGFALAEVAIAMGILVLITLVIGGLGQIASSYISRTQTAGTVLDLRNRVTALVKNPEKFLAQSRSSLVNGGRLGLAGDLYSGCIPGNGIVNFACPGPENINPNNLPELAKLSSGFVGNYAPVIDGVGQQLAGTPEAPFYLDSRGQPCAPTNSGANCPLLSTGYFLRENSGTNVDPGDVRFLVGIDKNPAYKGANVNQPFKSQFLSIDVSKFERNSSNTDGCPTGSYQIGYQNGAAKCINPVQNCPAGEVAIGVDASGNTVCKAMITCAAGQHAIVNVANQVECVAESPCGEGQIFSGFISGSAHQPMCISPNVSCSANQLQIGTRTNTSGNLEAKCISIPTCSAHESLNYDGSIFACGGSNNVAQSCPANQIMTGIGPGNVPICEARATSVAGLRCPAGQFVNGQDTSGGLICASASSSSSADMSAICSDLGGVYNATTTPKCKLQSDLGNSAVAKAWVVFAVTVRAPYVNVLSSFNVTGVTSPSVGDFVIKTQNPITYANGVPMAIIQNAGVVGTNSVGYGISGISGNGHSDHQVTAVYYGTEAGGRARIPGTLYVIMY